MIGKYIGGNRIKNVKVLEDDLTPAGSNILEFTYEDGGTERIPGKMVEAVLSDEPLDPSALRDKRVLAVCQEVLEIFAEYDIKLNESEPIQQTIKMSLDENFARATEILWKTSEKRYLDMYRVLKAGNVKPVE